MIESTINDAEQRMKKSIEALKQEMSKMRSGRAHSGLLDQVMVPYYGNMVPLSQVATVTTEDARTLLVQPWEKTLMSTIEKAILTSDLGLNPAATGVSIRVPLPALTEDRRKDMIKVVRAEAENARVAMRNVRRDANGQIKELLKTKKINEDDERRAEDRIQKMTDKYVEQVDSILSHKEKELMEV